MKSKICLIVPYFGKFNNYFQLFLNSCKFNPEINWLFFTDDQSKYDYPSNVKVIYMTFSEFRKKIQSKFDFRISLERPYKLCDYKCAYGYICSDYLIGYDFWGYCDIDLIFGKITDFITEELLRKYDKIGVLGHFTIFRNDETINRLFMSEIDGTQYYRNVYQDNKSYIFDEEFNRSINTIFEEQKRHLCYFNAFANLYTKTSDFKLITLDIDSRKYIVEKRKRAFFVWENGSLSRYYLLNGKLVKEDFMYMHLMRRKMKVRVNTDLNRYKIIPNAFEPLGLQNIYSDNLHREKAKHFNLHYFRIRTNNLINKIKMRFEHE